MKVKDVFSFGGFLKANNKRREDEAMNGAPAKPEEASSGGTMSQADFSYGPEGMRRKPKAKKD
jgi:hypothetical protein